MLRWLRRAALVVLLVAAGLFLNNTSLFARHAEGEPVLLAHRGIAQRFETEGLTADTCTAARMLPPKHEFLENTIPSMKASFEAGADIVELDVHPTTDGRFAVFHDWTIDCRTEGTGVTREQSMDYLKTLDVGYGYTADGGETYPFRGKGIGMMPTLEEVLGAFPESRFLINMKSNDAEEGRKLAAALADLPAERRAHLMIYGADAPVSAFRQALPDVATLSKHALKSCLVNYFAYGWSGVVPDACRSMAVFVPINVAPWLWGWPDRFMNRMASAGSDVFVIGPYNGEGFSKGIDSVEDIEKLPENYSGGVLTNEIELVADRL